MGSYGAWIVRVEAGALGKWSPKKLHMTAWPLKEPDLISPLPALNVTTDEQTVLNQHTPYYLTLTSVDTTQSINMTRSHKFNDKDHAGLADGTAAPEEHLPRYFAKSGHLGEDPKKIKKNGHGKANWGNPGEEILDDQFNFANSRRRSNSSGFHNIHDFKTKFEVNEPEPVFEETIHGPADDELTKTESSSTSGGSIDEMPAKSV